MQADPTVAPLSPAVLLRVLDRPEAAARLRPGQGQEGLWGWTWPLRARRSREVVSELSSEVGRPPASQTQTEGGAPCV